MNGVIDEVSLYRRALSASEVQAIWANGAAGKFNATSAFPQNLAEASIAIPGAGTGLIYGDNTNWQQQTISFTATSTSTPVVISGLEPGMLLDAFSVSGAGGGGNLYYLPEQSLDPLVGTSPFGTWQLEIQDDRVGATNHAVLDSWQLQFVFAQTNQVPANLGVGVTNSVPAGGTFWVAVNVPTNADFATNILTFATGPLNMWYSTNVPPTIVNPGDVQFLSGQTAGSETLGTNGSPVNTTSAYIVPGGTYYIGLENTGAVTVNFGFVVDFHLLTSAITNPFVFTQPAQAVTGISAQLNGMATPNGLPATAWFEWGTNTLYGNSTPPIPVGAGFNVVYTTSVIPLVPNLPYHFRLVVSNATTVVYGFDQILDESYVVAWGANYVGQGTVPPGLSNVVAIAGAYDHSLAVKNDETVVAWGDNLDGQATVPAGLNNNLVAVASGETYSLALNTGGIVVAWGGDVYPGAGETNVPAGLNNVVMIGSGQYSSLALKIDGYVVACGASIFNLTNLPSNLSNAVDIAGGSLHCLAIKNDGTVIAWGDNGAGQTNVPAGLTNVVAIAAGSFHSLALKNDGTVVAWGYNNAGQATVPSGLSNVVAVAAGYLHSLALKNDGSVVAWGDNSVGQSSVPVGLTNVVAITSGIFHSMALTSFFNVNPTNPIVLNLSNGVPQTGAIGGGGIVYYQVNVPVNADFATNNLFTLNTNQTLNLWFTTHTPPTITNVNDTLLLAAVTNGSSILSTISAPANIVPGSVYYLGVQNTNNFSVSYTIGVNFHLLTTTNPPTVPISSIIYTNIGGTNGFLLTWFAPSNDLFQVQWTTSLAPPAWTTFTNPPAVSYNTNFPAGPTNAQFNFFDDGSQTGGFGPTRFYRLILLSSPAPNTPPVLPPQTTQTVDPLNLLTVTNTATDAQSPPQILTYVLSSPVTGANMPAIDTNGIITWTPDVSQAGTTNLFTTIVTDNGVPPMSATNSFSVIVNPVPDISGIVFSNGGFLLTWFAPTNDIFQVQVATNLASPTVWLTFTNFVTYTGPVTPTNGLFSFYDNGTQIPFGSIRFYRLQLVGTVPPPAPTVPISSITPTNGGFLLTWFAPTNDIFQVQVATNLASPTVWLTFTNFVTYTGPVTPTNGLFSFYDNGTQIPFGSIRFYRLQLVGTVPPATTTVPINSITPTNGQILLTWFAPTNDQFSVRWATNLAPPVNWFLFPGTNTSTTGVFTFTDTNTPLLLKFYELILLP